ncbi:MAG: sulfatase [Akkermansiaceae bacterium]|nr:sulfatase [Akkermansiaceae bacterium]
MNKSLLSALGISYTLLIPISAGDRQGAQASTAADRQGAQASVKPNILFILADDLGWTDLSTGSTNHGNGSDFYETPNIDRLAREGMSFTSAYMQPNCAPTRAALLSGQYAPRSGNGVYNVSSLDRGKKNGLVPPRQNEDVPASSTTVAEAFQQAGYVTAHFGKYHAGGHEGGARTLPEAAGFDYNFAGGKAGHPPGYFAKKKKNKWAFPRGFSPSLDPFSQPYDAAYVNKHALPASAVGKPKHLTDALADAFDHFLAKHVKSDKKNQPLYIHYWLYAVHTPIQPQPDIAEKFAQKKKSSPSKTGHDNTKYAALVADMDRAVGRIMTALDDPNGDGDHSDSITKNTLVVFSSDNGGHQGATSNRPLRRAKGTFYEGGVRVPLIIRQPGTIEAGSCSDTMVHAVDYYPTFLATAGIPSPQGHYLDGHSFAEVLTDPNTTRVRPPICYHFPGYMDDRASPSSTIISEIGGQRYKLIHYYEDGHSELYNISKDISETTDMARKQPEGAMAVKRQLYTQLHAWLTQTTPGWQPAYPADRATGEQLTAPTPPR